MVYWYLGQLENAVKKLKELTEELEKIHKEAEEEVKDTERRYRSEWEDEGPGEAFLSRSDQDCATELETTKKVTEVAQKIQEFLEDLQERYIIYKMAVIQK